MERIQEFLGGSFPAFPTKFAPVKLGLTGGVSLLIGWPQKTSYISRIK